MTCIGKLLIVNVPRRLSRVNAFNVGSVVRRPACMGLRIISSPLCKRSFMSRYLLLTNMRLLSVGLVEVSRVVRVLGA